MASLQATFVSGATMDLDPPTSFRCSYDSDTKKVTCTWIDPDEGYAVEVHEFNVDPINTLKETVPMGVCKRVSGPIKGGQIYTYAARTVMAGVVPSEFSQPFHINFGTDVGPTPPPTTKHPSDVLPILKTWTVMLPTGTQGSPDNAYRVGETVPDVFFVGDDGGVVFRADANGVHSKGSRYVRAEGRQMEDALGTKSSWTSTGPRTLEVVESIDATHLVHQRVNGIQIHGTTDDVCQIMLNRIKDADKGMGLGFAYNDGHSWIPIDPDYKDGTKFTCKIGVRDHRILVFYNGKQVVDIPQKGLTWYWKCGCYNQTGGANTDRPEPSGNFGQVTVYSLSATG